MENPSNTSKQSREGDRQHPSPHTVSKDGDRDDLEPPSPPTGLEPSRDPHASSAAADDESIPEEFAWMDPAEYHLAIQAQKQMDEAKRSQDTAPKPKSGERFPSTTSSQFTGEDARSREGISPSLKSGSTFPHEVPWSLPQSGEDVAPGAKSLSKKKLDNYFFPDEVPWRAGREHLSRQDAEEKKKSVAISPQEYDRETASPIPEDLVQQQMPRPGAVAVSGQGEYNLAYDSVAPSGQRTGEGQSDVLLSAVVVQGDDQSPRTTTTLPEGEPPYAEATVVPYKRRRRIAIGLVLLLVIGAVLGIVFALKKRSDVSLYQVLLTIVFRLDSNPNETGFTLQCSSHTVTHVPPGSYEHPNVTMIKVIQVVGGDYCTLTVIDTGGDGIDEGYFAVYFGDVTEEGGDPSLRLLFLSGDFTNKTSGTFTSADPEETEGQTSLPTTQQPSQSSPPTSDPSIVTTLQPTLDSTTMDPTLPLTTLPPTQTEGPEPTPPPTADPTPPPTPDQTPPPTRPPTPDPTPPPTPDQTPPPTPPPIPDPTPPPPTPPPTPDPTPPPPTPPPTPDPTPPPPTPPPTPDPTPPPPTPPPTPDPTPPPPTPPPTPDPTPPPPTPPPTPDPTPTPPTPPPTPPPTNPPDICCSTSNSFLSCHDYFIGLGTGYSIDGCRNACEREMEARGLTEGCWVLYFVPTGDCNCAEDISYTDDPPDTMVGGRCSPC